MTAIVRLSGEGQIAIPKEVRDSLHWGVGIELMLVTTKHGVMLRAKEPETHKITAKSLRGFLQHTGEPVPTNMLCKPVEYANDCI